MKRDDIKTRHSQIFEYWKNKAITPGGQVVECSDLENDLIVVIYDWGEPRCCACGEKIVKVLERNSYKRDLLENIKAIWDYSEVRSKLNRCHIVPRSIGGSERAENLFLLCEKCHLESPDTDNPKNFFLWVYERRIKEPCFNGFVISEIVNGFLNACKRKNKDPKTFCKSKMKDKISCHGGNISQSSIIFAMADCCEDIK